jgi:hypothetical protein
MAVSNHIPPNTCTVSIEDWRKYAYACGISAGEERANQQAFKRALDVLIAGGHHVGIRKDQAWLA